MRDMMAKLKLTVNETKTRAVPAAGRDVRLSGLHDRPVLLDADGQGLPGHATVGEEGPPRLRRDLGAAPGGTWLCWQPEELVARLNRMLVGWANYFCLGPVSQAYRAIDQHVCHRLRQWLCAKHKVQGQGTARFPDEYLYQELGLVRLSVRTRTFSWAKA